MKPVTVDQWIERNEQRVIEMMVKLYPQGCKLTTIRSFLRSIHQSGISEGLVPHMERRGLIKTDNASDMIYLTAKAKSYVA